MSCRVCDVAVVGGGPAGSIAARWAAAAGADVVLIEEHPSFGSPVQCAGIVSTKAVEECGIGHGKFVLQEIRGASVHAPDGSSIQVRGRETKAFVLDRMMFDLALAQEASRRGADIMLKTHVSGMERKSGSVVLRAEREGVPIEVRAGVVIGADGVQGNVRRWSGLAGPKKMLSGIQFEGLYRIDTPGFVDVFLGNNIAGGFFAWAIPTGYCGDGSAGIARIGLATERGHAVDYLKSLLRHPVFRERYRGSMTDLVVGGIPLGMPASTVADCVMLVGDAAGQVKPTSGGGIYMGAVCAKIAGEVAAGAALSGDTSARRLMEYERRGRAKVGKELLTGWNIHEMFRRLSDDDLNAIIRTLGEPDVLEAITEYGDIDHPSRLAYELAKKPKMVKLLPAILKSQWHF